MSLRSPLIDLMHPCWIKSITFFKKKSINFFFLKGNIYICLTLDHKTSHKGQFVKIEIYT